MMNEKLTKEKALGVLAGLGLRPLETTGLSFGLLEAAAKVGHVLAQTVGPFGLRVRAARNASPLGIILRTEFRVPHPDRVQKILAPDMKAIAAKPEDEILPLTMVYEDVYPRSKSAGSALAHDWLLPERMVERVAPVDRAKWAEATTDYEAKLVLTEFAGMILKSNRQG